jgi:VanZ family protein
MTVKRKIILKKISFFVLLFCLLGVIGAIFFFSSQSGSQSVALSDKVALFLFGIFKIQVPSGKSPSQIPFLWGLTVRKCAHIFFFLVLGFVSFFFYACIFHLNKNSSLADILFVGLAAFATCILCACVDELHQSFVADRTASLNDVGIDAMGLTCSTWICTIVIALIHSVKRAVYTKHHVAVS